MTKYNEVENINNSIISKREKELLNILKHNYENYLWTKENINSFNDIIIDDVIYHFRITLEDVQNKISLRKDSLYKFMKHFEELGLIKQTISTYYDKKSKNRKRVRMVIFNNEKLIELLNNNTDTNKLIKSIKTSSTTINTNQINNLNIEDIINNAIKPLIDEIKSLKQEIVNLKTNKTTIPTVVEDNIDIRDDIESNDLPDFDNIEENEEIVIEKTIECDDIDTILTKLEKIEVSTIENNYNDNSNDLTEKEMLGYIKDMINNNTEATIDKSLQSQFINYLIYQLTDETLSIYDTLSLLKKISHFIGLERFKIELIDKGFEVLKYNNEVYIYECNNKINNLEYKLKYETDEELRNMYCVDIKEILITMVNKLKNDKFIYTQSLISKDEYLNENISEKICLIKK